MTRFAEKLFEGALWRSRFVIVIAVVASMLAAIAVLFMTTVDVWLAISHIAEYADTSLSDEARRAIRDNTITHVVEMVDGYLLAAVMFIFALGLYELFVSDIDEARESVASSRILVIESLDDLKNRLAKVILMILIVKLFEHAVRMKMANVLDLLYLGGAIALVGVALYLTHGKDSNAPEAPGAAPPPPGERAH